MGQARARGTYAERKAEAIERAKKLAIERAEKLTAERARRWEPDRRFSPSDLRALAALNIIVMTSQDWAKIRLG